MDPLGFALESFSAVGQSRTLDPDTRTPIDASGVLPDGTPVASPRTCAGRSPQSPTSSSKRSPRTC